MYFLLCVRGADRKTRACLSMKDRSKACSFNVEGIVTG